MAVPGIDEEIDEDRDIRLGTLDGVGEGFINIFFSESCVLEVPFPRLWVLGFELWRTC